MGHFKGSRTNVYLKAIYILAGIIIIESIFFIASCQRKEKVLLKKPSKQFRESQVQEPPKPKPIPQETYQGKIAIVLDDWGYNLNNVDTLREIKEPLTLAVLPRRAYSGTIANTALELRKELVLHLPLEPHREKKYRLEPDTILITMAKNEVLKILDADIKNLPGIKGISNHMGSLATENVLLMGIIFAELKKRKLYFLDSYTGKTICKDLARNIGIAYLRRQVFLDNKNDAQYIRGQIELLAKIAQQSGYAIGIGHDRPKTLEALAKAMPDLKKRGFKFVYLSQLVK